MSEELPTIIKRALAYGLTIYPHALPIVLKSYNKYKIPHDILIDMIREDIKKYIRGLYLSGLESAGDWTEGHKILEELGFSRYERQEGHRCFVSMGWPK